MIIVKFFVLEFCNCKLFRPIKGPAMTAYAVSYPMQSNSAKPASYRGNRY